MTDDRLPCGVIAPAGIECGMPVAGLVRTLMKRAPKWELGGKGPDAFDCWSMTQLIQYCLFGRVLREVDLGNGASRTDILRAVSGHDANAQWQRHDGKPAHGNAVTMAHGDTPWHVGVWLALDRGVIAHIGETSGFCIDDATTLKAKGFSSLRYHRFKGGAA